jgi:hypothetical protein
LKIIKACSLLLLIIYSIKLPAQNNSNWADNPELSFSGFLDVYYVYDFNKPRGNSRQDFLYNHNRHNEFNINLGLIGIHALHEKYRANLVVQSGTYAADNYAAEHPVMQHLFEANIGVALNKANNLWLDAGIMPSHIGFESAISTENLTLTRSLLAENSPYFLTGTKLTYQPNEAWELALLVVNGWQRIRRLADNSLLSWGTQMTYSPSENFSFNWSTFIGTDDPDVSRRMRYFNNFYFIYQANENISLIAGSDFGLQQRSNGSSDYDSWFCPVVIMQYRFTEQWAMAVRAEYYRDVNEVIIESPAPNGFNTRGMSINFDYNPVKNIFFRIEGRWFNSAEPAFRWNNTLVKSDFMLATSLALKF